MTKAQEEALREQAAMGALSFDQLMLEICVALRIARVELDRRRPDEAQRYATLAADLVKALRSDPVPA